MNKKLSIKQRVAITTRGYGVLEKYCPGLVRIKALLSLVTALQPFAPIWFSALIINEISTGRNIEKIVFYVASVVLINLIISLIKSVLDRICSEKESQMWSLFGKVFSDKQMSMDYVDLENAEIQHQKIMAEENLYMFGNGLGQVFWGIKILVEAVINIIVPIAMLVTLFTSKSGKSIMDNPICILVILICILFGGICNSKAFEKEMELFEEWTKGSVWFNRVFMFYGCNLYMMIEKAKDLRIYQQNFIADKFLKGLKSRDNYEKKHNFRVSMYQAIACGIIGLSNVVSFLFVTIKCFYGAFGVGSILQYVGALSRLGDGVQGLMYMVSDNAVYCGHLKSLYEFLDIPNKKYQGTLPIEKRRDNEYEIEFHNVSFKYPTSDTYALRDFNLKINIGKRMAVVGMNGSGKTTMIKLLCRLYDPTEGSITLNGIDIKKFDYLEYMSIFSVVFQDFKLFSFTLGQNVAASMEVDKVKAINSLEKAGFSDRLNSMANGIETNLYKDFEEDGIEISGGEAQKIALARALYKDSPFIVLDEPTAALDPIAEFEIYSRFNEIVGDKTAIFISHRLSSCRFCDDIAVFHEGRLIQRGDHDTLLGESNGKYYELWNAQAQYYEEKAV